MKRVISWTAFGLLFLAVTAFCLSPHSRFPIELFDKAGHFAAFAALAFVAVLVVRGRRSAWLVLAGAVAWAGIVELGQLAMDGAHAHVLNAIADAVGAAAGVLLAHGLVSAMETVSAAGDFRDP